MKKLFAMVAAVIALALGALGTAHATVDSTITAGISQFGTDGTTYATAIMSAAFAIWAVRKLARKMGWS